jgi:hypothetical protein
MISTFRLASLALAALHLSGCDPEERALGSWELATIDGVGPAVAAPLRVVFPAGVFGRDTLADNGMWHEVTIDDLVLTLEPGGTFRERVVEAKRSLVRQSTFERPDYVSGAFGGDLIRDDAEPSATEASGSWTLAGDTLVLTAARAQSVEALAARMRQALPEASEDVIRDAADAAVPSEPSARWRGALRGDQLELVDAQGRAFVFRRGAPGG